MKNIKHRIKNKEVEIRSQARFRIGIARKAVFLNTQSDPTEE
jgi:hypothetical protein